MLAGGTSEKPLRAIFALRRFVHPPVERCELCRASLPAGNHAHLLEKGPYRLLCACAVCAARYGKEERGFLPVTPRNEKLSGFALTDADWELFQIPIDLAFLVRRDKRLMALYPGPAGIVQAEISGQTWSGMAAKNPVLETLEPEVEALVIHRVHGRREAYRLSIDHCFSLAGMLRKEWRGLSGGPKVWEAIEHYFDQDGSGHA